MNKTARNEAVGATIIAAFGIGTLVGRDPIAAKVFGVVALAVGATVLLWLLVDLLSMKD